LGYWSLKSLWKGIKKAFKPIVLAIEAVVSVVIGVYVGLETGSIDAGVAAAKGTWELFLVIDAAVGITNGVRSGGGGGASGGAPPRTTSVFGPGGYSRSPFVMNFQGIDGNQVNTPGEFVDDFFLRLAHLGVGIIAGIHEANGGTVLPPASEVNRRGKIIGHAIGVVQGAVEAVGGTIVAAGGGTLEVGTLGGATPVAVPATAAGVAVAGHGVLVGTNASGLLKADMEGPSLGGGNPEKPAAQSAQYKKLSDGEIKQLQKAGIDPHELKPKIQGSRYDLFKDEKGNIFVKLKDGSGSAEPTGLNIRNLPPKD